MNTNPTNITTECPFDKDLRAYRDRAMSDKRRLEVRDHVRGCAACKSSVALMKAVDAELAAWSNTAPVPSTLRERIVAEKAQTVPIPAPKAKINDLKRGLRLAGQLVAVLGVVVLIAAIMFPIFAKSREKARQTSPASEAKQAELERINAAQDNQGDAAGGAASYLPTIKPPRGRQVARSSDTADSEANPETRAGASDAAAKPAVVPELYATVNATTDAQQPAAPSTAVKATIPAPGWAEEQNWGRKIVYTATVDLTVAKLDDAQEKLRELVTHDGGFIEQSTMDAADGGTPSGTWQLRVPSYDYEEFMGGLQGLGHVNTLHQDSEDVSDQYKDLSARISQKRIEENRLQNLLASRKRGTDVVELEQEIEGAQGDLEQLVGQQNVMVHQIAYSTIALTMSEKAGAAAPAAGLGSTLGASLKGSFDGVVDFLKSVVIWLAVNWPWLIVLGVAAWVARRWIIKRRLDMAED